MAELGALLGGRYRLDQVLGQGGMATIFRATDDKLGREVAVKVLRPEFGADAQFVERFEHEAQAAASLSHPNIVKVFSQGVEGRCHYIAMELAPGGSLHDEIRRTRHERDAAGASSSQRRDHIRVGGTSEVSDAVLGHDVMHVAARGHDAGALGVRIEPRAFDDADRVVGVVGRRNLLRGLNPHVASIERARESVESVAPLAEFSIQAKLLAREDYRLGREADLSPVDPESIRAISSTRAPASSGTTRLSVARPSTRFSTRQ